MPPGSGRPPFERIVLLLQGGGALGAYQAGAYQALHEAGVEPNWIAGISMGAINGTLIAGNAPERRIEALRTFWETVTDAPFDWPALARLPRAEGIAQGVLNQLSALGTLFQGAPEFFTPRIPPPFLQVPGTDGAISYYDTMPLRATLQRLADFGRLNGAAVRVSLGAVDVSAGNQVWFDTTTRRLDVRHVLASSALPPSFAPVEIDGTPYWDGGVVSNTPLQWVLDSRPRADTLAVQIDLWNARGEAPRNLAGVENRIKDIQYSSRVRLATDLACREHTLRHAAAKLARQAPAAVNSDPTLRGAASDGDEHVLSIVQLTYRARHHEGVIKDYDFSRRRMEEHWASGYSDASQALSDPKAWQRPTTPGTAAVFKFGETQ